MALNIWSRGQDLNLRPSGYEPDELPDCSTPHCVSARLRKKEIYAPFPTASTMWRHLHNSLVQQRQQRVERQSQRYANQLFRALNGAGQVEGATTATNPGWQKSIWQPCQANRQTSTNKLISPSGISARPASNPSPRKARAGRPALAPQTLDVAVTHPQRADQLFRACMAPARVERHSAPVKLLVEGLTTSRLLDRATSKYSKAD